MQRSNERLQGPLRLGETASNFMHIRYVSYTRRHARRLLESWLNSRKIARTREPFTRRAIVRRLAHQLNGILGVYKVKLAESATNLFRFVSACCSAGWRRVASAKPVVIGKNVVALLTDR